MIEELNHLFLVRPDKDVFCNTLSFGIIGTKIQKVAKE